METCTYQKSRWLTQMNQHLWDTIYTNSESFVHPQLIKVLLPSCQNDRPGPAHPKFPWPFYFDFENKKRCLNKAFVQNAKTSRLNRTGFCWNPLDDMAFVALAWCRNAAFNVEVLDRSPSRSSRRKYNMSYTTWRQSFKSQDLEIQGFSCTKPQIRTNSTNLKASLTTISSYHSCQPNKSTVSSSIATYLPTTPLLSSWNQPDESFGRIRSTWAQILFAQNTKEHHEYQYISIIPNALASCVVKLW